MLSGDEIIESGAIKGVAAVAAGSALSSRLQSSFLRTTVIDSFPQTTSDMRILDTSM